MPRGRTDKTLAQYKAFQLAVAKHEGELSLKAICKKYNLPYRKMLNLRYEEGMKRKGFTRATYGWKKATTP